jgi:predicted RNase H-like nuclease (RuvC/YqgF family)
LFCFCFPTNKKPAYKYKTGVHLAAKPVIVGIDPGATTGVAVLDLDGNLLLLKSKKNLLHSEISRMIYDCGIPIIMASDKNPLPRTVERISASFPSKLSWPTEVLSRLEKLEMTRKFAEDEKPWSNMHERDALAAAVFAHNRIKALVERINRKTATEEMANYVAMNVILRGRNIDESVKQFNSGGQIIMNEKRSLGKPGRKNKAKKTV